MSIKRRSIHRKKSVANKQASKWRKKGYTAQVKKGSVTPGTNKAFKVKGYQVTTGRKRK